MTSRNRVALITGAAAGIGAGIAARFHEAGYAIGVFDIDADCAERTAARLARNGPAIAISGDVASEEDARSAVERTFAEFGALHVLVNNAGIEVTGAVPDLASAEWDRQIAVNLRGAFLFSKYAIPRMRAPVELS